MARTLVLMAIILGLFAACEMAVRADAAPEIYYQEEQVGDIHYEYAILGSPLRAFYSYAGAPSKLALGRATFLYNPAGAPTGVDPASITTAPSGWNTITPNLQLTYGGTTALAPSLCRGTGPDGVNAIGWGVIQNNAQIIAMACWWGTQECDIQLGLPGSSADVKTVLQHELGHCIGLGHSADRNALMYAVYQFAGGPRADDVLGLCVLYGGCVPGVTVTPPPTPFGTPAPTGVPTVAPTAIPTATPPRTYRGCDRYIGLPNCGFVGGLAGDGR